MQDRLLLAQRGFTLVEIMIAVVIVAILAAVALPNYSEHVRRAQRIEARGKLMEARHWMEQQFTINNSYDGVSLPAAFAQSPQSGEKLYDIELADDPGVTPTTYTLLATRVSSRPDKCGTFSIDQSGQRGLLRQSDGLGIADCWGR